MKKINELFMIFWEEQASDSFEILGDNKNSNIEAN